MMNCDVCKEILDRAEMKMWDIRKAFDEECKTIIKKYSNMEKDLMGTDFSDFDINLFEIVSMRMYLDIAKLKDDLKRAINNIEYESSSSREEIERCLMIESGVFSRDQYNAYIESLSRIMIDEISEHNGLCTLCSNGIAQISSANGKILDIKLSHDLPIE